MGAKSFLFDCKPVSVLTPAADVFTTGVDTDVVCLRDYRRVVFLVHVGAVEDGDVSNLITLNACTDAAKSGATPMGFQYSYVDYTTSNDAWGAYANATASGFNFADAIGSANGGQLWLIEAKADEVAAALDGADFCYLTIAETADKTVLAGITAFLMEPRYPGSTLTAIA